MAFCVPLGGFGSEAVLHAFYNPMERIAQRMRSMSSFISIQFTQSFIGHTGIESAYP